VARCSVAVVLATFVLVVQAGVTLQNLGTAPQVNVAVQGEQTMQPEATFLNLINWIGNVIAPSAPAALGSWLSVRSPWAADSPNECSWQSDS